MFMYVTRFRDMSSECVPVQERESWSPLGLLLQVWSMVSLQMCKAYTLTCTNSSWMVVWDVQITAKARNTIPLICFTIVHHYSLNFHLNYLSYLSLLHCWVSKYYYYLYTSHQVIFTASLLLAYIIITMLLIHIQLYTATIQFTIHDYSAALGVVSRIVLPGYG